MALIYCSQGHDNPEDHRFCRFCGAALTAASQQPGTTGGIVGQLLACRYQVVSELGQGGFGRTYLAEDRHRFQEACVLKEFAPQVQGSQELQKAEELFAREAGILYKLQHPQIPHFRELFRAEVQGTGRLFLVQDFVDGETYHTLLQQRLKNGTTFTEAEVTELLDQLLPVLSYIHAIGVIHRDISPDNLIRRQSDGLPVLIDFGGVKQIAATVASEVAHKPRSGVTRLGKAGYAPAEQMELGQVSAASDLYALGITALVLLTGREPQELIGRDRRQWQRQVKLSPHLVRVFERMLSPVPQKRYPTAQAVLQALSGQPQPEAAIAWQPPSAPTGTVALSPGSPPPARPTPTWVPQPKRHRVSSLLKGILPFFLVAGAAIGGWWEWRQLFGTDAPPPKPKPTQSSSGSKSSTPAVQYTKAEQARKQKLKQQQEQLGIDRAFLVSLADETFYANHPSLNHRALSDQPQDDGLRREWDETAIAWLDQLQALSRAARSRLGRFTDADLDQRRIEVNKLNLSSRALNDLTDAQFFHWFPELPRTENLLQRPIGQVWHAIAVEQMQALKAGTTLKQVQFPLGSDSQVLRDRLQPGAGKAYLAKMTQNQAMTLSLTAPNQATQLSIYPPSSKSPALLEDSPETQWAGKLPESGIYEIVVVSTRSQPVAYDLDWTIAPLGLPSSPLAPTP